jgi:hypothetical protein
MILTFLDPAPRDPRNPYTSRLFFYAITSLPPRLAEGTLSYDALTDQLFGIQTREFPIVTFEDAIELLVLSLYTRGLLKPFATHKHHGLTNNLLGTPEPFTDPTLCQQGPLVQQEEIN